MHGNLPTTETVSKMGTDSNWSYVRRRQHCLRYYAMLQPFCHHEESQEELQTVTEGGAAERNAENESWKPQIRISFVTALFLDFQLLEPIF